MKVTIDTEKECLKHCVNCKHFASILDKSTWVRYPICLLDTLGHVDLYKVTECEHHETDNNTQNDTGKEV